MHLPTWDIPVFKCSSSNTTRPNTKASVTGNMRLMVADSWCQYWQISTLCSIFL